jgi:hypothetical protein
MAATAALHIEAAYLATADRAVARPGSAHGANCDGHAVAHARTVDFAYTSE